MLLFYMMMNPPVSPCVTYLLFWLSIHRKMYIQCIYKNVLEYKKMQGTLRLSLAKMKMVLGRVDI